MWVLVAVFAWNSAITIPNYSSLEDCNKARAELIKGMDGAAVRTACVPKPI